MANRSKAEIEQGLPVLGELTEKDAADEAIEAQYSQITKALTQYEQWLTQAFLADGQYLSQTWAISRDEQLQTAVLSLTLTPGGLPVSNATHDAWKQHGTMLDEELRESDARLALAQKWVKATELVGAIAGIASGGFETAAAQGGKAAATHVAKEVQSLSFARRSITRCKSWLRRVEQMAVRLLTKSNSPGPPISFCASGVGELMAGSVAVLPGVQRVPAAHSAVAWVNHPQR